MSRLVTTYAIFSTEYVFPSSTVEEDITVAGVTVGNISSGDVVQKGRDLTEVLKQMLVKEIDVKAVAPSVTMFPSGI